MRAACLFVDNFLGSYSDQGIIEVLAEPKLLQIQNKEDSRSSFSLKRLH